MIYLDHITSPSERAAELNPCRQVGATGLSEAQLARDCQKIKASAEKAWPLWHKRTIEAQKTAQTPRAQWLYF